MMDSNPTIELPCDEPLPQAFGLNIHRFGENPGPRDPKTRRGFERTPPLVDIRRERPWPGRGDGREDMLDTLEKEAISQARLYKSASRATKRSNNHVSLGDEASSAKASSSTNTWESDGHARAPSKERSIIGATERGRGPERNKYWEQTPPFSQGYNDRNTATFATGSIPPAPTHSGGEGSDSD
ncbi:unnamed protein product [Rhizoctonia solani]|uniref:Uncharacterized protein n=1 Tax=Rhizoctonia solani TaxID=456999 RepID=A0A8H3D720_9AGAM|nr:unnamed protein product [Rhizoctonia solani]